MKFKIHLFFNSACNYIYYKILLFYFLVVQYPWTISPNIESLLFSIPKYKFLALPQNVQNVNEAV